MAPIDKGKVADRLDYIKQQKEYLSSLPKTPSELAEKLAEPLAFHGAIHMLQTSVEAMIDIAYHLCAKLLAKVPDNAVNAFEILAASGDLPQDFLPKIREMINFRNLVVHGYLHTQPEKVREIILHGLNDFDTWEEVVLDLLRRKA